MLINICLGGALNSDPLVYELKTIIDDYRGGVMALAKKAGIFHNTLRNISKGKVKKRPKPETVLKIATASSNKRTIVEVADHYGGEIRIFLKRSFGLNFEQAQNHTYNPDISSHIDDFYKYVAFKLCHKEGGVDRFDLELLLANIAIRRMDEIPSRTHSDSLVNSLIPLMGERINSLIEEEVLVEKEKGLLKTKNEQSYVDIEIMMKYAADMTIFVKSENFAQGLNMFIEQWEYTNEIDLKRALKVYYAGMMEAHKILMGSKGDIPVQMISMFETLTLEPLYGGNNR